MTITEMLVELIPDRPDRRDALAVALVQRMDAARLQSRAIAESCDVLTVAARLVVARGRAASLDEARAIAARVLRASWIPSRWTETEEGTAARLQTVRLQTVRRIA